MGIEQTREIIVRTAQKLFARFGFNKTSMDEIARVSRKAKGSLYYHFSSKEDLFREVVQKEIDEIKKQLEPILYEDLEADQKLKKFLTKHCELVVKAINYLEGIRADLTEHLSMVEDLRKQFIEWEKCVIQQILHEGIQTEIFPSFENLEAITSAVTSILRGLEASLFLFKSKENPPLSGNYEVNILVSGLKYFKR